MNIDFAAIQSGRSEKILVIGDVMLDRYLWGSVSRISPEAPVPVVNVQDRSLAPGGAGNVAANLCGLKSPQLLIGVCGNDETGKSLRNELSKKGIEHLLLADDSRPTISKTRVMAHDRQLLRLDEEKPQPLGPELREKILAALEKNINDCRVVILSDYGKGMFHDRDFCGQLINACRRQGIPVLVDPKGRDWDRYRGATCITPNLAELKQVSDLTEAEDDEALLKTAAAIRNAFQIDWLLVTRGPRGMCLAGPGPDDAGLVIPARAAEVYDVSGAGDTVIATLAFGLAAGLTLPTATELANLAAGVVVGKLGTQPITFAELKAAVLASQAGGAAAGGFNKTASLAAAAMLVKAWKSAGQKVVFTNGCFDLLHPGHIHLLHKAAEFGDRLVVGLNSDSSIKRLKGEKRPILSEKDRGGMLGALGCVDLVVLFAEDTPITLIETLQPDVLVKGSDYRPEQVVGGQAVIACGGRVQLVQLLAGFSTTGLVNRFSGED